MGRADERVVAAIEQALQAQKERSTGTLSRLRRTVGWILEDIHGAGAVKVPPASTFNRLVHALADRQGLLGTAAQRRRHSSRPAPPFTPTVALRPGLPPRSPGKHARRGPWPARRHGSRDASRSGAGTGPGA
ncbi:hypothetical protein GCM10010353_66740 [Streptomyces chryseus]|nr:hypothetical protein GCM10010353_66740 [Streptomyces chryseus]